MTMIWDGSWDEWEYGGYLCCVFCLWHFDSGEDLEVLVLQAEGVFQERMFTSRARERRGRMRLTASLGIFV